MKNQVIRILDSDIDLLDYLNSIYLPNKFINTLINNKLVKKEGNKVIFDLKDLDINDVVGVNHPIDIVYEDSEIIVINKERGVLVHSDGESSETLLNYVSYYLLNKGEALKPRCVHRIDLDTIGLVLFSKNIISYYHLFYQMNNQMIEKRYYAVVKGKVASGLVDAKIGKNRHINNKYLVTKSGKEAKTIYDLISYKDDKSLIDVKILTGRTHQIRVHMAYISHPILGDNIYGSGNKLQLENYYLGFINPSDNKYQIIKIDNKLDY